MCTSIRAEQGLVIRLWLMTDPQRLQASHIIGILARRPFTVLRYLRGLLMMKLFILWKNVALVFLWNCLRIPYWTKCLDPIEYPRLRSNVTLEINLLSPLPMTSREEMEKFGWSKLLDWFIKVEPWSKSFSTSVRSTWLTIEGVPLQA